MRVGSRWDIYATTVKLMLYQGKSINAIFNSLRKHDPSIDQKQLRGFQKWANSKGLATFKKKREIIVPEKQPSKVKQDVIHEKQPSKGKEDVIHEKQFELQALPKIDPQYALNIRASILKKIKQAEILCDRSFGKASYHSFSEMVKVFGALVGLLERYAIDHSISEDSYDEIVQLFKKIEQLENTDEYKYKDLETVTNADNN